MRRARRRWLVLGPLSVLVAAFLCLSVFLVYTGLLGDAVILPALATLASAVAFGYAFTFHRFSRPLFRALALVPTSAALIVSGALAVWQLQSRVSVQAIRQLLASDSFQLGATDFLPRWWVLVLLLPAVFLTLLGALHARDTSPYPKPGEIREIAMSPVYFGLVSSVFGLWAVLFVGITLQRVIVIAPLFEELLKFGVALLIASTLFGRSLAARIGIAIVIGASFGLVEHATTYPTESDLVYLHRTLFHTTTTVLSVSIYSLFEATGEDRLRWIAPAYSILLHFFYNTFAVLSTLIAVAVFGSRPSNLPLYYGLGVFLIAAALLLATVARHRIVVAIHRPIEHVLSHLA